MIQSTFSNNLEGYKKGSEEFITKIIRVKLGYNYTARFLTIKGYFIT